MQDHYRTLGLLSIADDAVIKAAFKALAQKYHPDKYKGDSRHAQKVMADLNAAYAALKTKALRQAYDTKLSAYAEKNTKQSPPPTKKEVHEGLIQKIKKMYSMKWVSLLFLKNYSSAKSKSNQAG